MKLPPRHPPVSREPQGAAINSPSSGFDQLPSRSGLAPVDAADRSAFRRWIDDAAAFVVHQAESLGWRCVEAHRATTGTLYLKFRRAGERHRAVRVRLADHRSGRLGDREFSIRVQRPRRLLELVPWLRRIEAAGVADQGGA